jgi:hypothetical protein
MNWLVEILFCPQHGLLRPDNIVLFMAWAGGGQEVIRAYAQRLKGWFI